MMRFTVSGLKRGERHGKKMLKLSERTTRFGSNANPQPGESRSPAWVDATLANILQKHPHSDEIAALRVLQALEAAASDPHTQTATASDTITLMRTIHDWLLPGGIAFSTTGLRERYESLCRNSGTSSIASSQILLGVSDLRSPQPGPLPLEFSPNRIRPWLTSE
jgi:hypothetical protein